MRPVTGPPQAGTYIQELLDAPGKYTTMTSDQPKMVLTNDPQSDAAKFFIESMGNDVYRVVRKGLNIAPVHNTSQNTVSVNEGPAEWRIKETDVPGVYSSGPAGRPDLHACAEINGDHVSNGVKRALPLTQTELELDSKVVTDSRMATKYRLYRVDE
ncbi:hypothetical protein F5887DRAFT_1077626 [Amanita rubescens]|nr:hypothetical protein F5887DRAFT_1077626 [Amanita rubescens]